MEDLKKVIANNIASLRKGRKLTQLELAEALNYSDKAISKWECGDTLPDIETFTKIAQFFGVSLNELLSKNINFLKNITTKNVAITLFGFFLVWLTTCVIYYFLNIFTNFNNFGIVIICALPLSMVELTVFACIWFNKIWQFISITLLIWSVAVMCYFIQGLNTCFIFIIALVLEIMLVIWFWLRRLLVRRK